MKNDKKAKLKQKPKDFSVGSKELVGRWFVNEEHLPPLRGVFHRVGYVIGNPEPFWYMVEIVSVEGLESESDPRVQVLVHMTNLSSCKFFANSEAAKNYPMMKPPHSPLVEKRMGDPISEVANPLPKGLPPPG